MLTTRCVKKLALICSWECFLYNLIIMIASCVLDWAQCEELVADKIIISIEQFVRSLVVVYNNIESKFLVPLIWTHKVILPAHPPIWFPVFVVFTKCLCPELKL